MCDSEKSNTSASKNSRNPGKELSRSLASQRKRSILHYAVTIAAVLISLPIRLLNWYAPGPTSAFLRGLLPIATFTLALVVSLATIAAAPHAAQREIMLGITLVGVVTASTVAVYTALKLRGAARLT